MHRLVMLIAALVLQACATAGQHHPHATRPIEVSSAEHLRAQAILGELGAKARELSVRYTRPAGSIGHAPASTLISVEIHSVERQALVHSTCSPLFEWSLFPLQSPPDQPCRDIVAIDVSLHLSTADGQLDVLNDGATLLVDAADHAATHIQIANDPSMQRLLGAVANESAFLDIALELAHGKLGGSMKAWLTRYGATSFDSPVEVAAWEAELSER